MYEVHCTITSEQGSRAIPTGHAFHTEEGAWNCAAAMQRAYLGGQFWVEEEAQPGAYC